PGVRLGDAMEITLPDQIKLYFDKAGLGDPTFIFIHGGGADSSSVRICPKILLLRVSPVFREYQFKRSCRCAPVAIINAFLIVWVPLPSPTRMRAYTSAASQPVTASDKMPP